MTSRYLTFGRIKSRSIRLDICSWLSVQLILRLEMTVSKESSLVTWALRLATSFRHFIRYELSISFHRRHRFHGRCSALNWGCYWHGLPWQLRLPQSGCLQQGDNPHFSLWLESHRPHRRWCCSYYNCCGCWQSEQKIFSLLSPAPDSFFGRQIFETSTENSNWNCWKYRLYLAEKLVTKLLHSKTYLFPYTVLIGISRATGLRHGGWGRYRKRGRYLCSDGGPRFIGVEVALGSVAAISKVDISNGHCSKRIAEHRNRKK